jgi:hypothetical protein
MKQLIVLTGLLIALTMPAIAQTTQTSGNWSDPSIWSGGSVPAANGTVVVNNPVTIDATLAPTGSMTFNANATDQSGGTAYNFNPNAGNNTITINSGSTVTFEGGTSASHNTFNSGNILIYGTLILGYTDFPNNSNLNVTIEAGGTLIINGDLSNKNNQGTFTVNGALIVNGNFGNNTGNVTVGGTGTINTTGSLTTTGGSTVFGYQNDCNTGPCSGTSIACSFGNTITPASKTVCSGTSGVTLTSTNGATSPTYQWLSSTDGVNFANASGTSTNNTYVTPAMTQTTWYEVTVKTASCTSTSAPIKFTVLNGGGWLGGTSNDWGTAANWCANAVPTSTTDVTITNAAGITYMPTVNTATAATARNLTVSNTYPASSLTIAASATASLSLFGDLTINGSFTDKSTAAAAGVIMAGSVAQNINGSSAPIFNNLTINNTSGAMAAVSLPSNNIWVTGSLSMTSGNIYLSGNTLTIGTTALNVGSLTHTGATTQVYGGNFVRWYPTSGVTYASGYSLYPVGDGTNYRPIYFASSGLTTGGTIKVTHTSIPDAVPVNFPDGGSTVLVRSKSYWTVYTGNGIAGTGSPINIRTEGTGFGVIGNVSDLRLTLVNSAAPGTAVANAGTVANPQVFRNGLAVSSLANTYYWGSVNPGYTTLPVSLLSFTAQPQSGSVLLNWQTSAEHDCNYFALERSADGSGYKELTRFPAAGGSDYGHQYAYTDISPNSDRNYYRLKIVSNNGTVAYSWVVTANFTAVNGLVVFPNPTDGRSISIRANVPNGALYTLDIYSDQGMLMRRASSSASLLPISFSPALTPGIYAVRVSAQGYNAVGSFLVTRP